jgi:hypothetical protein
VIRDLIADNGCNITCVQETKLQVIDDTIIAATLGQKFVGQYTVMPAQGTRGGILLGCSQNFYSLSKVDIRQFSVTVTITRRVDNENGH